MFKRALIILPLALAASPALAQSASGTVNVTGNVGAKCTAITPITGTIPLGELALADGTVDTGFTGAPGPKSLTFTVRCTSADATIKVSATPLVNASATTENGYTGTVHYTTTFNALVAGGTNKSIFYTTADTLPAETSDNLGGALANATPNLLVAVSNGSTTNATDLLKAGAYAGVITLTVAPL